LAAFAASGIAEAGPLGFDRTGEEPSAAATAASVEDLGENEDETTGFVFAPVLPSYFRGSDAKRGGYDELSELSSGAGAPFDVAIAPRAAPGRYILHKRAPGGMIPFHKRYIVHKRGGAQIPFHKRIPIHKRAPNKRIPIHKKWNNMNNFHGDTFSGGFGDFSTAKRKRMGDDFHGGDTFSQGFGDFATVKKRMINSFHGDTFSDGFGEFSTF